MQLNSKLPQGLARTVSTSCLEIRASRSGAALHLYCCPGRLGENLPSLQASADLGGSTTVTIKKWFGVPDNSDFDAIVEAAGARINAGPIIDTSVVDPRFNITSFRQISSAQDCHPQAHPLSSMFGRVQSLG